MNLHQSEKIPMKIKTENVEEKLEIKFVTELNFLFSDVGSGAEKDLSIFRPQVPEGFVILGDFVYFNL